MKYSEFKTKVEGNGFGVLEELAFKRIYVLYNDENIGYVSMNTEHFCDTDFYSYFLLSDEKRRTILEIVSNLTLTPLAEREEEKRYYLRNISPLLRGCGRGYLAKNKDTLEFHALSLKCSEAFYQTIFTESEIAQMDITGLEKVEVVE